MPGHFNRQADTRLARFVRRELKDLSRLDLYRSCAAEFIGVLLLTFLSVGTGVSNPGNAIASAVEAGFYIACVIRTLSTVSGGHVNPVISVGFLVLGQISVARFVFYTVVQTLGSASGTALIKAVSNANMTQGAFGIIYPGPGITDMQALVCEIVITFFLLFGTFAMIDPNRDDINGFAPFQIGLIVVINIFAAFNISGGCMNPARNFGPAMVAGMYEKMWIYWVGDMIGAVAGTLLYDKIFSTKVCKHWLKTGCVNCYDEEENPKKVETTGYRRNKAESDNEML